MGGDREVDGVRQGCVWRGGRDAGGGGARRGCVVGGKQGFRGREVGVGDRRIFPDCPSWGPPCCGHICPAGIRTPGQGTVLSPPHALPSTGPQPIARGMASTPHLRVRGAPFTEPTPACRGPGLALQAGPTGRCSRRARRVSVCPGPWARQGQRGGTAGRTSSPSAAPVPGAGAPRGLSEGDTSPVSPGNHPGPSRKGQG